MTREDSDVILGMTSEYAFELQKLRSLLINRYGLNVKRVEYKSEYLLQFIEKDPEAFLYCLIYKTDLVYDEKRLFPCLFHYPELIRCQRRSN